MATQRSSTASESERILAGVSSARDVAGGVRYDLVIANDFGRVPAILLLPDSSALVPAALLLHGLGSRKERMADTIGDALVRQGVAALAVDLPMHGGRAGSSQQLVDSPRMITAWSDAIDEARIALRFLADHEGVDATRLGLIGYSLGSFLANVVAGEAPNVRALVLAASGDLPEGLPFESLVRAVVDPLRAIRRTAGRPTLMVNGRFDRTVRPSQAERLFAAASEPKTMRWYGGGHWPPDAEIDYAAAWLARELSSLRSFERRPRTRGPRAS